MSLSRKIKNNKKWIDFISLDKENQSMNISKNMEKTENLKNQNIIPKISTNISNKKRNSNNYSSPQKNRKQESKNQEITFKNLTLTDKNLNFWNEVRKNEIDEVSNKNKLPKKYPMNFEHLISRKVKRNFDNFLFVF